MKIEKISIRGLLVDPILNSLNLHQKNCIPGSKEICSLQKRSWKLKRLRNQSEVLVFILVQLIFDLELIHVYRISLKDFHWHLPITDTVRASGRNVSAKSERSFAIACRKKLNSIKKFPFLIVYNYCHHGNWSEWSAIWSESICMILKLNKGTTWVWYEITRLSMVLDQNCTPLILTV